MNFRIKGYYDLMKIVLLIASDLLKGQSVYKQYLGYKKTLTLSKEDINELQFQKLKKLLIHSYATNSFYKERFNIAQFNPYLMKSIDDFDIIPPLTRKDLQENWQFIIESGVDKSKLTKGSSSGSTGMPVSYFKDSRASSAGHAANILGREISGWSFGYKGLYIWGNPAIVKDQWTKPLSKIKAFLFNYDRYPSYLLTDPNIFDQLLQKIQNGSYDYIDGYTSAIYLIAMNLEKKGIKVTKKMKLVLPTAETLQNYQRETIESNLGPVLDTYGCSEVNSIAYQCPKCKRYHVIDPHVFISFGEIVNENQSRKLYITDLDNYAFPLIKYENGDAAIPSENNDCKVPFSSIDQVTGRINDIITLKNGGYLTVPSFFGSMLLKKIQGFSQYQVIKENDDLLTIRIVKTADFTNSDQQILIDSLEKYLNNNINFQIKYVDSIEVGENGKAKLVIDHTKHY
jgi:phenylacetate-CoA ligase